MLNKIKEFVIEDVWWRIEDFVKNWIYPGYYLKNYLFNRYDLIRLPGFSKYEYSDATERMFYANMTLIVDFIEKEQPEKYVCWYKDEKGEDVGHKYGEWKDAVILYPEYKDKYIMDIIKEIYNWYKKDLVILQDDSSYLLSFWCKYIAGEMTFGEEDEEGLSEMTFDKSQCPETLEELEKIEGIKWDIIDKYVSDRTKILEGNWFHTRMHELDTEIFNEKQKYLHLCIEVRPYLWT